MQTNGDGPHRTLSRPYVDSAFRELCIREFWSLARDWSLCRYASGLLTQPFFDLRYLEVCADVLPVTEIFWVVSPVLSAASRRYWEIKSRTLFPSSFEPTLRWNRDFASQCTHWGRNADAALYFRPIRVGLSDYLGGSP